MNRVENLLEDLRLHRGTLFPIVTRLRAMALASGPALTEEAKYGGILFASRPGVSGVLLYPNHGTLEFGDGSTLPDPHGVLAGKGKLRRHIRIDSEHDLEAKKVGDYINAARARSDAV